MAVRSQSRGVAGGGFGDGWGRFYREPPQNISQLQIKIGIQYINHHANLGMW